MSAESSWDIQAGVWNALTGHTSLTLLLANGASSILDHVPAGTTFPYVVLGEAQMHPMDSQGTSGNDMVLTLHTYSRGSGMQEARHIMAAIYDVLHDGTFAVPNQVLILCQYLSAETRLEDDGITRHGVQRFQIITEPV